MFNVSHMHSILRNASGEAIGEQCLGIGLACVYALGIAPFKARTLQFTVINYYCFNNMEIAGTELLKQSSKKN